MPSINFVDKQTVVPASWLQAINDLLYNALGGQTTTAGVQAALGIVSTISVSPFMTPVINAADAPTARGLLGVPSLTGAGASGSWGIDISGTAAAALNGGVTSVNGMTGDVVVSGGGGGGGGGSVASVNVSAGTTGMAFTGGPITTSGTITMSGTLDIDNGGTGAATAALARENLNVPTRSGGDAVGTWPISISGSANSAATATTANNISGIVPITNGGTGASNAPAARGLLGVPSLTGAGASGLWAIDIGGTAAAAGTATVALNGGVTSVNSGQGGVTIVAGATVDVLGGGDRIEVTTVGNVITIRLLNDTSSGVGE